MSRIFNNVELEKKFYEFLIKSSSLENLFFFLDLHASKKKSVSPEIMRAYLILVYITPNSPLSINVDSEIKQKIIIHSAEPSLFDDAFHEVSWSLKLVTDLFLKRYEITELSPKSSQNPSFKLNIKNTTNIIESLLAESNVQIGKVTDKSISSFIASAAVLNRMAIDQYRILTKVQNRFFTNKKDLESNISYFYDNTGGRVIDKAALIDKTLKLKKKFGYFL